MKKIILLMFLVNIICIANGQNEDSKWSLGLSAGRTDYAGDLGNALTNQNGQDFQGFGALSIGRYLNSSFDLNLRGSYGNYGFIKSTDFKFQGTKFDGLFLVVYKLNNGYIFKKSAFIAPYLAGGAGMANTDTKSGISFYNYGILNNAIVHGVPVKNNGTDFIYTIGGGIKLNFSSDFALQFQSLLNLTSGDKRDFYVDKLNDAYFSHSVGIVYCFGKAKDTDNDGIPDKIDKCSNTPAKVKVDVNGCPVDTDGDGVADYQDKCPSVKGLLAFKGCPDSDGDGIQDAQDKCPNTPANVKVDATGCPLDTDGDAIPDYQDKCPKEKGLAAFLGCPDTDGDGIQDAEDRCPKEKGSKALQGCPDKDKDGVADIDDKCPDVPGIKENKGCPEIKAEVREIFRKALQGIQFATGKDVILKPSFPILDQVAKIMKENPTYKLIINGHTDNVGKADKNKELSDKRAASVKKYLLDKGIEDGRMKATGFGDTMPIADNKTKDGQKQNRRVEFVVEF